MFCPGCGAEERQESQFCRACGIDMRTVRTALKRPDTITASAVSAREEIGRAMADKIRSFQTVKEVSKFTEDVLPEVEKFLESPEERRMRRLRTGVITASIGLGATILLLIKTINIMPLMLVGWPGGLLVFFIGLGIILNGLLFTVPSKQSPQQLEENAQRMLSQLSDQRAYAAPQQLANPAPQMPNYEQPNSGYMAPPPSITENTTRKLPNPGDEPFRRITAEIVKK